MPELKLSLKRKEVTVELTGDDGVDRPYILRELTGKDRDQYTSLIGSKMRFDANGKPTGMKDMAGLQTSLLELCLFQDGAKVKKAEIEVWPSSTVATLFEKAQELSALTAPAEDSVGNG